MAATSESPAVRRKTRVGSKPATATPANKSAAAIGRGGLPKPTSAFSHKSGARTAMSRPAVAYHASKGVDDFVRRLALATPLQLMETERSGVPGGFLKDLSRRMDVPATRVFTMLGVPKATAEKKAAAGEVLGGRGGQAPTGIARLLGIAQDIVANSTAGDAQGFDSAKWLGQWLERAQPSLGGRKPGDLIDTPTGIEVVARLLGAIESGAYQ